MTLCQLLSHFPSASFSAEIKSTPSSQLIQCSARLSADFKCGVETGNGPNGPEAGRSTGCFYIKWAFGGGVGGEVCWGGVGRGMFGYLPTGVLLRQQIQTLMGSMSAQRDANWLTGVPVPLSVSLSVLEQVRGARLATEEQVRGVRLAVEAHALQGTVLRQQHCSGTDPLRPSCS